MRNKRAFHRLLPLCLALALSLSLGSALAQEDSGWNLDLEDILKLYLPIDMPSFPTNPDYAREQEMRERTVIVMPDDSIILFAETQDDAPRRELNLPDHIRRFLGIGGADFPPGETGEPPPGLFSIIWDFISDAPDLLAR